MATQFNYNLTPNVPQTSIGDMVNLARNVQAYQQAQQLNPLQLQQAQQNLLQSQLGYQQAQQMNPLLVRAQQAATTLGEETLQSRIQQQLAQTSTAQVGEKKAKLELSGAEQAAMFTLLGGVINDPQIRQPDGAKSVLQQARDRAVNLLAQDPDASKKVDAVFKPLEDLAGKKPDMLPQVLQNVIQSNIGAAGQQALQTPQPGTYGGQPGAIIPGQARVIPLQFPAGAPTAAPAAAPSAQPMAQQVNETTMQLPYPRRQAGVPFAAAPSEEADRASGQKRREALVERQQQIPSVRRNLEEVIKEATKLDPGAIYSMGVLGTVKRNLEEIIGTPVYKQLSKDLANVQIANIQATGGSLDTVAGQQLARVANGDETYPPEVLINIARRTLADLQDKDMRATGIQKFSAKYGDQNSNAFAQAWAKNNDNKVFEAISIYNLVQDPNERKKLIDQLMGSNPQQRKRFQTMYRNIKIMENGELPPVGGQ